MVMEAATLSGPQRKCDVAPVQKSLSLPSYARVGGEGIDHRLIFAALEQKEKVRRKSKIFTREKTARQNIFCLPISTSSRCRETSLSSDTSCSSLEYQKPKPVLKTKKNSDKETKPPENEVLSNEHKTNLTETKSPTQCVQTQSLTHKAINGHAELNHSQFKQNRSPVDTLRLNVGSSDSMDRSSRSSNDSLTRKERLVAIKARVEAEREKYGHSSSEEESCSNMTRYNSDGVIHRTVRDLKTKPSKHEKRLRRRSQGEWATKKSDRKNNLSLCLNPEEDGIKLHLEKLNRLNCEINNLEVKTDFCPSPVFPEFTKKSYFSDFPSKENMTKFVQQRIKHLEDEEKKRRSGSDFFDKIKSPARDSPLLQEINNSSEHISKTEKMSGITKYTSEFNYRNAEFVRQPSPIPKSTPAPTPPPRSPKSITYLNKAFLQHQNSTVGHQEYEINKKNFFHPNITAIIPPKLKDQKNEVIIRDSVNSTQTKNNPNETNYMRELFSSRRKTCGNFDFVDEKMLNDLCTAVKPTNLSSSSTNCSNESTLLSQIKKSENKSYFPSIESPSPPGDQSKSKWNVNKFVESERKKEYMFNSLENKKKCNALPWNKKDISSTSTSDSCLCHLMQGNKIVNKCISCESKNKIQNNKDNKTRITSIENLNRERVNFEEILTSPFETNMPCICRVTNGNRICNCYKGKSASNKSVNYNYDFHSFQPTTLDKESKLASQLLNNSRKNRSPSGLNDKSPQSTFLGKSNKSLNSNSTNTNSISSVNNSSATANLESAMAELESVYLSLKFSSDNLTDHNSVSNMSLSEEDSKISPKKDTNNSKERETNLKRNSMQLTNTSFDISSSSTSDKCLSKFDNQDYSTNALRLNSITSSTKSTENSDLSINELFKDLTPQLSIFNETVSNSTCNSPKTCHPKIDRIEDKINLNPSPVGFKKEFYENLQKQRDMQQKKKLKAVRSLSENISQLMCSPNSNNKQSSKNFPETKTQGTNNLSYSSNNSSPSCYKPNLWKTEHKNQDTATVMNRLERDQTHNKDEIRHIRVSMDSSTVHSEQATGNIRSGTTQYSRLTSAVHQSPQMSPKCEVSKPFQFTSYSNSKETIDKTIDGLEELLNSLLVDVPETKQSSLPRKKDPLSTPPPSPVSTGCREHVKINSYLLPSKMDLCVSSKSKSEVSSSESRLRNAKPEEKAQKENTDFRQNNNAHLNQTSFIPVYTKKVDMCHYFSDKGDESKHKSIVRSSHSPPTSQKCLVDQNEKLPIQINRAHMRRRSVGFEDMTSLHSCYLSNDKRVEVMSINSNITGSGVNSSKMINSDNDFSYSYGRRIGRENASISTLNQNSKVTKNANDQMQDVSRLQQYKDKSSKRKSSLNRLDFIDFPISYPGNALSKQSSYTKSRNSSSDEEVTTKSKQNTEHSSSIKRKHNISSNSKHVQPSTNEVSCRNSSPVNKPKQLPKSLQNSNFKLKQHKKTHSSILQLQKLSHSAGEIESLTDEANNTNKICLSAQEFDCQPNNSSRLSTRKNFKKLSRLPPVNRCSPSAKYSNQDASQQQSTISKPDDLVSNADLTENVSGETQENISNSNNDSPENHSSFKSSDICLNAEPVEESFFSRLNLNDSFELKHIDSKSDDDVGVVEDSEQAQNLDVSEEKYFEGIGRASDDSYDSAESDSKPNSILRKKYFGERRELHSILKPPPDDKMSRTPPSILKHRESSEEKDLWQQSDLHSILKKSASEDESCNSGLDIRPILKVSTDEDSPGGSSRPRPILKKRTSFSEECSYVSYPSNELRPILKKKTVVADDQPRPILKSRRKSEDTRSALPEFITSRPRAYSADMGVKPNLEDKLEGLEQKADDFCKRESQHQ